MRKTIRRSLAWAFGIITAIFTFVPESFFGIFMWIPERTIQSISWFHTMYNEVNIVINRIIVFLCVWLFVFIIYALAMRCRRSVNIKGKNYSIRVEYGDLFKTQKCKRVINFDECFTTSIGDNPGEIKRASICGQYLTRNPDIDVQKLIEAAKLKPLKKKSEYDRRPRYQPGSLVPNGDDLLMAFAPLDESGRGVFFTRNDYLSCLNTLWCEIDKYYGQKDVCIPLLGAGLTRFESASGASFSAQELLELIIDSYRLSSTKIKAPCKLRIICRRSDDLSFDKLSS